MFQVWSFIIAGTKYGYARVSTDDQNADMQLKALNRAGCKKIFKDECLSGATTKRPALLRCFKALQYGDRLVVWKLDRLARSLRDLITVMEDFSEREINFRSLTGGNQYHDTRRQANLSYFRRASGI